jgi:hypothetical protein
VAWLTLHTQKPARTHAPSQTAKTSKTTQRHVHAEESQLRADQRRRHGHERRRAHAYACSLAERTTREHVCTHVLPLLARNDDTLASSARGCRTQGAPDLIPLTLHFAQPLGGHSRRQGAPPGSAPAKACGVVRGGPILRNFNYEEMLATHELRGRVAGQMARHKGAFRCMCAKPATTPEVSRSCAPLVRACGKVATLRWNGTCLRPGDTATEITGDKGDGNNWTKGDGNSRAKGDAQAKDAVRLDVQARRCGCPGDRRVLQRRLRASPAPEVRGHQGPAAEDVQPQGQEGARGGLGDWVGGSGYHAQP